MTTALIALAGVLFGATAGAWIKQILDVRAGRKTRLLDERLKTAVSFLAAADRLTRASQSAITSSIALTNTAQRLNPPASPTEVDRAQKALDTVREESAAAWKDAQQALNAIRLLMPKASEAADTYLELCSKAGYPDDQEGARAVARIEAERALQKDLGL